MKRKGACITYEMYAVAASVIGGVSTLGGQGILLGTVIGASIWGVLQNGLQFAGAPVAIRNIVIGIIVILLNITELPNVLYTIFTQAWSFDAAAGGTGGYVIARAMQYGIARGMYSNEAGEGTAPFAHGCSIVPHPVDEGITGVAEVFIDTLVICSITALVVGTTGMYTSGHPATVMALESFGTVWAPLKHAGTFALLIFCFTTLMGQWWNAAKSFTYAFGENVTSKLRYIFPFLCIIGATTKITVVWSLQDVAMGLVVIPNMIALAILWPQVAAKTKEYFATRDK